MPLLALQQLSVQQAGKMLWHDLSFSLEAGERLGISAPSGRGKTTLGRVLAQWQMPTSGQILFNQQPLPKKGYCPIQLVPQHPDKCFNPFRTTGESVRDAWVPDSLWLEKLMIEPEWLTRRPNELSGGELARIALLRALDPRTQLLIADEVTAQLDAQIQAKIWQVLIDENQKRPLSLIIFSHNKALLEKVSTRIWWVDKEKTC
ncbi:ATP-binding cassette domain-containing protein [Proteus mirabilis]|uniref:ATP-binding cassette domain-containing protein n=1 Tax=Proteus mirabilis TaxID=584 RepID=UPI001BAFA98C|nr:ATP-binding cassette domain-containing protein [Proteus mirabilis]MBS3829981.1 ATP-binding cassette domain-containing protein [Proteus mirabilis]MBU5401634.1 ATP-binding cassette domain-containing protein [Proteus mirabilis]MCT0072438.1 ATP-binding cassette domain-containing protein [Proteus mirabilis]MDF7279988.1 ATP-binding cassette domain-containing protein [Proteus mirabilis]MDF7373152.1 ATP-binding cassette domain-containing protein [Proteus mirabilis]